MTTGHACQCFIFRQLLGSFNRRRYHLQARVKQGQLFVDIQTEELGQIAELALIPRLEEIDHLMIRKQDESGEGKKRANEENRKDTLGDPATERGGSQAHGKPLVFGGQAEIPTIVGRTISSWLSLAVRGAVVFPSAPIEYKSKSELIGTRFLSLRT